MSLSVYSLILYGIITAVVYRYISFKLRPAFLTVVSLVIYYLWAGIYALVILITELSVSLIIIDRIKKSSKKKIWLTIGICIIVLFLAFHKYNGFWITNNDILSKIIMPLGISYYSFKIISYMADMYRGEIGDCSPVKYMNYITLFPQIICGPISRHKEIDDYYDITVTYEDIRDGVYLILEGLFYKAVIADRLSVYTATVFENYGQYSALTLWVAVFFNAIELYCDFAGYSFIAIGLCRFLGFHIEDNFRNPYFSKNIREFWNRWHISLSKWLRDYIYIPLGGNRKGDLRKVINILIVFLISGIWHGNTSAYLLWGIWHFIWRVLSVKESEERLLDVLSTIGTFFVVTIGWIAFRLNSYKEIGKYFSRMTKIHVFSIEGIIEAVMPFSNDYSSVAKMMVVVLFITLLFILEYRDFIGKTPNKKNRVLLFLTSFILFGIVGESSFIYANF